MSSAAEYLHSLANHFARDDWQWTRETEIRHIRYRGDYSGYNHPLRRIPRALSLAFHMPKWERDIAGRRSLKRWLYHVWAGLVVGLRTDSNLPDGQLKNAGVIAFWEEDGEYLQMVQPSVGSLLADFLIAEPEHPHAQLISAELERLMADYDRRCREGEVLR